MKKLLLGILFIGSTFSGVFGQATGLDTIYRLGGRKMVVDVQKVTTTSVTYIDNESKASTQLDRKQIQRIVYNTGKVEVFNKPVLIMLDENSWEAVILTENISDVDGLYERGKINADSPPSSRSKKAAKRSCEIRMQKIASNRKGAMVLITHKEATGAYGELPGYYMEGTVYGFDPLTEEEEASYK